MAAATLTSAWHRSAAATHCRRGAAYKQTSPGLKCRHGAHQARERDDTPHGSAPSRGYFGVMRQLRTPTQHRRHLGFGRSAAWSPPVRQRSDSTRVVALALLVLAGSSLGSVALARSRRAVELETRLFAPCCYVQTLDVHESGLADALRHEIERRLQAGEGAQQIEDDLVTRFGERIRAVPRGSDPRSQIPLTVGIALSVGLLVLGLLALRWQRRQLHGTSAGTDRPAVAGDLDFDQELDEALRRADSLQPPPLSS